MRQARIHRELSGVHVVRLGSTTWTLSDDRDGAPTGPSGAAAILCGRRAGARRRNGVGRLSAPVSAPRRPVFYVGRALDGVDAVVRRPRPDPLADRDRGTPQFVEP